MRSISGYIEQEHRMETADRQAKCGRIPIEISKYEESLGRLLNEGRPRIVDPIAFRYIV